MENKETTQKNEYFIAAGIWSIVWSIAIYFLIDEVGIGYTLLNIPISFVAYLLGDAFRRFTAPDAFLTTGAWDTFGKKIFWLVGPQVIAMAIGSGVLYHLMYE